MELIVETDLGRDPDDFFTLCFLAAVNVQIRAVLLTPGDPDQIALAELIREKLNLNYIIGVSHEGREKSSCNQFHLSLLEHYGCRIRVNSSNEDGSRIFDKVMREYPLTELLIIGPAASIGRAIRYHNTPIKTATMQGGFLPYHFHNLATCQLDKFKGKSSSPSFNPNGDRKGFVSFCEAPIPDRRFVCKNICHTVVYDKQIHQRLRPHNPAGELFKFAMDKYLERHDEKMFHDPTAAVLHLHPEIGQWVRGKVVKESDGWTTVLDQEGDKVLADMDYEAFWNYITHFEE